MKSPRVLIVNGDPLNHKTANGLTLSSLFKGWDTEALAQIYSFPVEPDTDICSRNWRLDRSQLPLMSWSAWLQSKFKRVGTGSEGNPAGLSLPIFFAPEPRQWIGAWADVIPLPISQELVGWIEAFRPTLIYSNLANIRITSLVNRLASRFNLPVVPHFMDDWPTTRYSTGMGCEIPRRILMSRLHAALTHAPTGMVISRAMAQEYEIRYGLHFEPFMHCVEITPQPPPPRDNENKTVRFGYVGGLHLNRWRSLSEIGSALTQLRGEGFQTELIVHAPAEDLTLHGPSLTELSTITLGRPLQPEEVSPILKQFDVLVHIESFAPSDRLYTRLSVSTKIPQYMASGRPIFAYGPAEVASCRYIEDTGCGLVVGQQDNSQLTTALRQMVLNPEWRMELARAGYDSAIRNHDAGVERDRFKCLLAVVGSDVLPVN